MSELSNLRIRAATPGDLEALYALALRTGGGFTNLPADRDGLQRRLAQSQASMTAEIQLPGGELYLLVMEDLQSGEVAGTASLFAKLGSDWPFYSFRRTRTTHASKEMGKMLSHDVLHLVNDFDGFSEVGGLFLNPEHRRLGAGRLLARSRYLFMARLPHRFSDRVMADLRGYQDDAGHWPFWEALGRHFFDMEFEAADQFNGLHGNQFIADLMPRYPIYTRLLTPAAQAAIGQPHRAGVAAMKLLQDEGFRSDGYVDIFDGGPSVHARLSDLRTFREGSHDVIAAIVRQPLRSPSLIATGDAADYRCCIGEVTVTPQGAVISPDAAACLHISEGESIYHAPF